MTVQHGPQTLDEIREARDVSRHAGRRLVRRVCRRHPNIAAIVKTASGSSLPFLVTADSPPREDRLKHDHRTSETPQQQLRGHPMCEVAHSGRAKSPTGTGTGEVDEPQNDRRRQHGGQLQPCVPLVALKGDSYRINDRDLNPARQFSIADN